MFTVEEMRQLIAQGRNLCDNMIAETNRLNLLTYGSVLTDAPQNLVDVDLPTRDPDLMAMFREETRRRRAKSRQRRREPLASKENYQHEQLSTADEEGELASTVDEFFVEDNNVSNENPLDDERMRKVDVEKFLKQYYKDNAIRPVNAVEPGRLPYRHDQLLRMEQYRRGWAQKPAPGERSWRAERWRIRQQMAEQDVPVLCVRSRNLDILCRDAGQK